MGRYSGGNVTGIRLTSTPLLRLTRLPGISRTVGEGSFHGITVGVVALRIPGRCCWQEKAAVEPLRREHGNRE